MVSRERILDAAARVYAKYGFKGATTRLIAIEADVNEVTLFRTFGSKGALLEAVLLQHVSTHDCAELPAVPRDPHAELAAFIECNLRIISEMRPLLIHTMGESEDRPEAHEFACRGRRRFHDSIETYLRHLEHKGWTSPQVDIPGAAVMLTGTVISDVMGRPFVPDLFPPRETVAGRYATLFLRAIGFTDAPREAAREPRPALGPAAVSGPRIRPAASQPLPGVRR